jgi:hypothetical protein
MLGYMSMDTGTLPCPYFERLTNINANMLFFGSLQTIKRGKWAI